MALSNRPGKYRRQGVHDLYRLITLASRIAGKLNGTWWRRYGAGRYLAVSLAAVGVVVLAGCGELPQTIMQPAGDDARIILDLLVPILWIALVILVAVVGFLVVSMVKYRYRPGNDGMPPQIHGNTRLEITWMTASALIVAVLAVMTFKTMSIRPEAPGPGALIVEVTANQWWWEFTYPELDVVTANELYLPIGQEVDLRLASNDVIHSFWFPSLSGKQDVVPGTVNRLSFVPEEIGVYPGQCAEFCGLAHGQMRMTAFVVSPAEFDRWVEMQQTGADPALATSPGAQVFQINCAACHSIRGTAAAFGQIGPELTGIGARTTLGAGVVNHTPETLAEWIRDPSQIKPGVLMPTLGVAVDDVPAALSEDDITALVNYLEQMR
jgi:cytochrome c oxidase subunit 2